VIALELISTDNSAQLVLSSVDSNGKTEDTT